jgi:hypothetical protein
MESELKPLTTYIIPVRIESEDRRRNFLICLQYLLSNTSGSIIIKESDDEQRVPIIFPNVLDNSRITYLFEKNPGVFHRTKYLNDMLDLVETDITCNYDCDVILHPWSYVRAEEMIQKEGVNVVYPYPKTDDGQVKIFLEEEDEKRILADPSPAAFSSCKTVREMARYGFCFFVRTKTYKQIGGEHEGFVSWGPEDEERADRFKKLGLNLARIEKFPVFHMEHERGVDSVRQNPFFAKNDRLWERLKDMSPVERLEDVIVSNARGWRT